MTDKDKTVGGRTQRTRAEWFEALVFPFKAMKRADWVPLEPSDWDALLDAAFPPDDAHSRGLRDGLERAAGLVCRFCRGEVPNLGIERRGHRWIHYTPSGGNWYECFAAAIQDEIARAEASKLDGEPVLATIVYDRKARTVRVERPEPPAEERSLVHGVLCATSPCDRCRPDPTR